MTAVTLTPAKHRELTAFEEMVRDFEPDAGDWSEFYAWVAKCEADGPAFDALAGVSEAEVEALAAAAGEVNPFAGV